MTRALVLVLVLCGGVASADQQLRLLLLPSVIDGVARDAADAFDTKLAAALSASTKTIRWEEISPQLSADDQVRLSSCAEPKCLMELGKQFELDRVLAPKISRQGKSYRVLLKIFDAQTGQRTALVSDKAASEQKLAELGVALSPRIMRAVGTATPQPTDVDATDEDRAKTGTGPWPYVALGSGALLLGSGTYWMLQAKDAHDELVSPSTGAVITPEHRRELVSRGSLFQTLGWGALGAGTAAIAAGVISTLQFDTDTDVSAWIGPNGGGITARIALP
ncbi:MAG: hypothetical protein ACJ790_19035 [Myxococcaceae bacterium]